MAQSYEGIRRFPRDSLGTDEYTPLPQHDVGLNSAGFTPSVRVVKKVREGDNVAREFIKNVHRVLQNKRKGRERVSAPYKTPFHAQMLTEIVSQKKFAEENIAAGFNPRIEQMRKIALLLRGELMDFYGDNPQYRLVKLGKLATDDTGKREKIVILPDALESPENEICRMAVKDGLPRHIKIDLDNIQGNPGIVIGSAQAGIPDRDFTIIKKGVSRVMPTEFLMDTVVELHTGMGRRGVEEFPLAV